MKTLIIAMLILTSCRHDEQSIPEPTTTTLPPIVVTTTTTTTLKPIVVVTTTTSTTTTSTTLPLVAGECPRTKVEWIKAFSALNFIPYNGRDEPNSYYEYLKVVASNHPLHYRLPPCGYQW